jgi:nucleoside-diphosphate-sugar epimerase
MSKSALVTGGTGFIGHHLANQLQENGYKVLVVDRALNNYRYLHRAINLMIHDITKPIYYGDHDVIFHLAALRSITDSFKWPREYIETNIWGTYDLIKQYPDTRIVFASSSAAAEIKSVYGITKKSAEHFLNLHKNSVSIRFMNIFGEHDMDTQFVIPAFCSALKNNKKAVINGDGSCKRDFTYVLDLVNEIIKIGESRIKGQTETGYGTPISILDLYSKIAKLADKKANVKFGPPRRGDVKSTCSKYKIKEPHYGFSEGLRRTVRFYLEEKGF